MLGVAGRQVNQTRGEETERTETALSRVHFHQDADFSVLIPTRGSECFNLKGHPAPVEIPKPALDNEAAYLEAACS
jgi:hypothetical protein